MTQRYRSQGSTHPDRAPAIEGILQQFFAGFFQILQFLDPHTLFPGAGYCTPTLGTMPGVRQGLMPL